MGPLFIDLKGVDLEADEREMLAHPLVAGVILFTRNFQDRDQLIGLVRLVRESRKEPLLIVTDHEGGRVQRFRHPFSHIPAAGKLSDMAASLGMQPTDFACEMGWLMAAELRACDIDLSLAPVLDCHGISDVIGDRAFSQDPEIIINLAQSWIKGMHQANMRSVGKHFPGHGSVKNDSHVAQAIDIRSYDEIRDHDLIPFTSLIISGLLDAIMPAHVIYPAISEKPAGFSKQWIQDILSHQLGFNGLVFSDDLSMKAASITGSPVERALQALAAGCHLLLACNDRVGTEQLLDGLDHSLRCEQAFQLRGGESCSWEELHQLSRFKKTQQLLAQISD
ncbi:MAG: Beta-hexosaminidase [Candidatus Celerinatantimonas neptuna]|nr:MAG: Beta-hexosaminidase [Candidatus Celerinatantimonas neptuna]